jgi:putative redox protein
MSVEISGRYLGDLKIEATHGPSGAKLKIAAPVDNEGDGSSFSPTDLAATALGSCMCMLIAIVGRREKVDLDGLAFRLEKHMASNPRRLGSIPVTIQMPAGLNPDQRKKLENAALTCPVHKSLDAAVERPVTFVYPEG